MGVYRSQPQTEKHTLKGSSGKISFCSVEMQGWRKNMQDAAIHEVDLGDGNALFAVFDGHGGSQVSQFVRQTFVKMLKETPQYGSKNYVTALDITFKKMDQVLNSQVGSQKLKQIRSKSSNSGQGGYDEKIANGCGCTANVVLITPQKYIVANAGDSRSVLSRNGGAIALSEDHKPQNQIESKRVYNAGGTISMGRIDGGLNLSRSLGDFDYKQNKSLQYDQQKVICKPDVKQVVRQGKDEFIIIGCDGIWQRYVDNNQGMIDYLKKDFGKKQTGAMMEELLDQLLAKDTREGIGCDNMSAILVTFK